MYLLQAPIEKFGNIPFEHALLLRDVKFTNNIATCRTQYQQKVHKLLGCVDITPPNIVKIRKERKLKCITFFACGGIGDSLWVMPIVLQTKKLHENCLCYVITEKRNFAVWKNLQYVNKIVEPGSWEAQACIEHSEEVYDFGGIATALKEYMHKDPVDAMFEIAELQPPKERKDFRPSLTVTAEEGKLAMEFLEAKGIDTRKDKFVCIGVEPSTANRYWPFDYVKTLTQMIKKHGARVTWLGESPEFAEEFLHERDKGIATANLVRKTNLRECLPILALADAYIGPNSGLMVIATALETPTIGLFGAFEPKSRAKYYDRFLAAYVKQKCSPCNDHWTECREGHPAPCMKAITPERVYSMLWELVRNYPRETITKLPMD